MESSLEEQLEMESSRGVVVKLDEYQPSEEPSPE
jgi:hypothetical protein